MSARLTQAQGDLARAQLALERVLVEEYPAGSSAAWWRSGRLYSGTVLRHGYNGRLFVRNGATGRGYWISAGDIIEATVRAMPQAAE